MIETLWQDLRYAVRGLRRTPAFTAAAVLTLALGIGANTAIFTVLDALMLKPLPVDAPDELVTLYERDPGDVFDATASTGGPLIFSYPRFQILSRAAGEAASVAAMGRVARFAMRTSAGGTAAPVQGQLVSGSYFATFRAGAARGRLLTDADNQVMDGHPVAVISHRFWQNRFGAGEDAIGRDVWINGRPFTIVGVAAPGFTGVWTESPVDVWMPAAMQNAINYRQNVRATNSEVGDPWMSQHGIQWLNIVARVPRGELPATLARLNAGNREGLLAFAQISEIPADQIDKVVDRRRLEAVSFARGFSRLRDRFSTALLALTAMVVLVLLVACVNVANLLLARAAARQREVAVRASLGAGRWRLVRQHLTESLVLALVGGAAGLLVGRSAGVLLAASVFGPEVDIAASAAAPGARVAVFAAAVSLATAVVFGLAPALNAARLDLAGAMAVDGRGSSQGHMRGMRPLVAAQLALSFVVVVAATLFGQSLLNYMRLDPGFDAERVVAVSIDPLASGYRREDLAALNQRMVDIVTRTPGVVSAAVAGCGLMDGCRSASDYVIEGYQPRPDETVLLQENFVGADYFETVGMPLLEGRGFERGDFAAEAAVAVVNETAARRYFAGRSAIGRRLGYDDAADMPIVGVVRDARVIDLQTSPEPMIFMPQRFPAVVAQSLHVRVTGDAERTAAAVRAALERAEPALVITRVTTLQDHVERSVADERLVAYLTSSFAALALVLAGIGLYGVLSYSVARRTQEFGVRAALGAAPGDVARLILADGALVVAGGLAAGAVSALLAGRLIASLLFGVSAADPATYAAVAVVLAVIALLACYVPARRASRVDPILALRAD